MAGDVITVPASEVEGQASDTITVPASEVEGQDLGIITAPAHEVESQSAQPYVDPGNRELARWGVSANPNPGPRIQPKAQPLLGVDMTPEEKARQTSNVTQGLRDSYSGIAESPAAASGIKGYPDMLRAAQKYVETFDPKNYGTEGDASRARTQSGSEFITGATEAATPLMGAGLIAAPIRTALGIGTGLAASYGAGKVAEKAGASPETQELTKDIAFFLPSVLGAVTGLRGSVVNENGVRGATVSALGDRVGAGIASTPDGAGAAVKIGGTRVGVGYESATDWATRLLMQSELARRATVEPPPPETPPPPPPGPKNGTITPEHVEALRSVISSLPKEQQGPAVREAHANLAQWIANNGTVVGPDGKVYIAKNLDQAGSIAAKWVNEAVTQHDQSQDVEAPGRSGPSKPPPAEAAGTAPTQAEPNPPAPTSEGAAVPQHETITVSPRELESGLEDKLDRHLRPPGGVKPEAESIPVDTGRIVKGVKVTVNVDGRPTEGIVQWVGAGEKSNIARVRVEGNRTIARPVDQLRVVPKGELTGRTGTLSVPPDKLEVPAPTEPPSAAESRPEPAQTETPQAPGLERQMQPPGPSGKGAAQSSRQIGTTPENSQPESTQKYEFGSTQINVPSGSDLAAKHAKAAKSIADEDLAAGGREEKPHVTIRYGLKDTSPEQSAKIKEAVKNTAPFWVGLGETKSFPAGKDGIPLFSEVQKNPELENLRKTVEGAGDFKADDHGEYRPHVTLGYVKPGTESKYLGKSPLKGETVLVDHIAITKRDGSQEIVPLEGSKLSQQKGGRGESPEPLSGHGPTSQNLPSNEGGKQEVGRAPGSEARLKSAVLGPKYHIAHTAAPTVLVARHGPTDANGPAGGGQSAEVVRGHRNVPLNPEGHEAARAMGEMLREYPITHIISSDLDRAHHSAQEVAKVSGREIPVTTDKRFRPWDLGDFVGQPVKGNEEKIRYFVDHPTEVVPNGESYSAYLDRIEPVIQEAQKEAESGKLPLLLGHNSNLLPLEHILNGRQGDIPAKGPEPGSVVGIQKQGDSWALSSRSREAAGSESPQEPSERLGSGLPSPNGKVSPEGSEAPGNGTVIKDAETREPEPDQQALFNLNAGPVVSPFFLKSERVVAEKIKGPMGGPIALRVLENSGVKQDELKWTGLDEFLKSKEKVTPQQIQQFLRENDVQVKEIEKSDRDIKELPWLETKSGYGNPMWVTNAGRTQYSIVQNKSGHYLLNRGDTDLGSHDTLEQAKAEAHRAASSKRGRGGATKFATHQLPGGENYRELLLTLPQKGPKGLVMREGESAVDALNRQRAENPRFTSSHFDEPNVLAHVRFNDRTDADGKKVLFLEEIQSDWHQKGRREGYSDPELMRRSDELEAAARQKRNVLRPLLTQADDLGYDTQNEVLNDIATGRLIAMEIDETGVPGLRQAAREYRESHEAFRAALQAREGVPDAPFKKDWHEMALRRMIRFAAEHGYDKLGWTTGAQQAERYHLSKQVKRISWADSGSLYAYDHNGSLIVNQDGVTAAKLPDYIGKDAAEKLLATAPHAAGGLRSIEGEDLKVGGEGMKGFYDKIIPDYLRRYGKKWGATVGASDIELNPGKTGKATEVHSLDITPEMKRSVMEEGQPLFELQPLPKGLDKPGRVASHYAPPKNGLPPIVSLSWKALDLVREALGGNNRWLGASFTKAGIRKVWPEIFKRAEKFDAEAPEAAADIRKLGKTLMRAENDAGSSGVVIVAGLQKPGAYHNVLKEEVFHAMQLDVGGGSMIEHARGLMDLLKHPAAKKMVSWLKKNGYDDVPDHILLAEVGAKIGSMSVAGESGRIADALQALSAEEATDWFWDYIVKVSEVHGLEAANRLMNPDAMQEDMRQLADSVLESLSLQEEENNGANAERFADQQRSGPARADKATDSGGRGKLQRTSEDSSRKSAQAEDRGKENPPSEVQRAPREEDGEEVAQRYSGPTDLNFQDLEKAYEKSPQISQSPVLERQWLQVHNALIDGVPFQQAVEQFGSPSLAKLLGGSMETITPAIPEPPAFHLAKADDESEPPERFKFEDSEVEKSFEDARGLKPISTREKFKGWLHDFGQSWVRKYATLPREAQYEPLRFALTTLEHQRAVSADRTQRVLDRILSTLGGSPERYYNFSVAVILNDLMQSAKDDLAIPFYDGDVEQMKADHKRITELVKDDEKIQEALRIRKEEWEGVKSAYVKAAERVGFKVADRLKRESYFHHQVLEYAREQQLASAGKKLRTPTGRGYLKQREGSDLPINTDYLQSEFKVMSSMILDTKVNETIRKVQDDYDISEALKRHALIANEAGLKEYLVDLASQKPENEGMPREVLEEEAQKEVGKLGSKQAFALQKLGELAARGDLPVGERGEFRNLVNELARGHAIKAPVKEKMNESARKQLIPYAQYLLKSDNEPGRRAAATLFRGMSEKRKAVKEALGNQYATWQTMIPEGYRAWQPREGRLLYWTKTIPEHIADSLLDEASKQLNVSADTLRNVLAQGQRFREMVLPDAVADTLDNLRPDERKGQIEAAHAWLIRNWKIWTLHANPASALKFRLKHFSGQSEAMWIGNKGAFGKLLQSGKELHDFYKNGKITPTLDPWLERGGASQLSRNFEAEDLTKLEQFARLYEQSKKSPISDALLHGYINAAQHSVDFMESLFRYAAYLDYLEQMKENGGDPKNFGASIKDEVLALKDPNDRAYKMANDLLGAYDDLSVAAREIRKLMPFWAFREINFKRYKRLFQNKVLDGGGNGGGKEPPSDHSGGDYSDNDGSGWDKFKAGAKFVGKASPMMAMRAGMFLSSALSLWGICAMWNYWHRDQEEDVPEDYHEMPHLVLGRDADGQVLYTTKLGLLPALLDSIGPRAPLDLLRQVEDGHRSIGSALAQIGKATWGAAVSQMSPLAKGAIEIPSRTSFSQDVFQPRPIRDRMRYLAGELGTATLYDRVTGAPTRKLSGDMLTMALNKADAGASSYYDVLQLKRDWLEKFGDQEEIGASLTTSPRSEALRNLKLSMHLGDTAGAEKFAGEYFSLGGTLDKLQSSLKTMDPLYGLSGMQRAAFVSTLSEAEMRKLQRAEEYYFNYLAPQGLAGEEEEQPDDQPVEASVVTK